MRLPSGAHFISTFYPFVFLSVPSLTHVTSTLSFQVHRPHLSLIAALSGRVHPCFSSPHLPLSTLHLLPRPDSTSTPPLRFTACAPIFTPHTPSYHAQSVSPHALAISPLALISRALCLLNETLPPSLLSFRACRSSTLRGNQNAHSAGTHAFTCVPQTSHPSPDSFISALTPSHTSSGHRLFGGCTSDLRHQTHACCELYVGLHAP